MEEKTIIIMLSVIIWIGYGLFACLQTKDLATNETILNSKPEELHFWIAAFMVLLAPVVFVYRVMHGIFRAYKL